MTPSSADYILSRLEPAGRGRRREEGEEEGEEEEGERETSSPIAVTMIWLVSVCLRCV